MRNWSSSTTHTKSLRGLSPLIFFIMMSLTTAVTFHALAETQVTPLPQVARSSEPDPNDIGDTDLPSWCPPSNDPGLAVVCGTVVTAGVREVRPGTQQANVPIDKVLVAAYEENRISPTGKISGALTNIFSSTKTNKEGRYRILIRRVKPPRLKVHLVFICGSTTAQEIIVDSWHNTWGLFTQVDCEPRNTTSTYAPADDKTPNNPPFPLRYSYSAGSFLGCTNDRMGDSAIGLKKQEEPVINTIINENNYDHRFNMNTVQITSQIPGFFNYTFTSPGGLWEPDCLLRNKEGTYQCNALLCRSWEKNAPKQPCTSEGVKTCGPNNDEACKDANLNCGVTPGYTGVKVYAASSCVPDPNDVTAAGAPSEAAIAYINACKEANEKALAEFIAANNKLPSDPIDGVLCDAVSGQHADVGVPMAMDDYITRPFFKYIPKGPAEYDAPFRRFEYRNNLQNFAVNSLAPMQWINTYIGSAENNGSGFAASTTVRGFMDDVPTTPNLPSCNSLYDRNMPMQAKGARVGQNRLINTGFITALAEPGGAYEETYYSGQKDLSAYVCQQTTGQLVRLCEIQVPWGEGALCDLKKPGCKDPDIKTKLKQSLNKLGTEGSLIDPNDATQVSANINNMLNLCGKDFKLGKLFFPQDLIFKGGNTQMGLHSDTPNDSISAYAERRTTFMPASSEQEAEALTGSRIVFQGGGNFMANSYNTIVCALNPKECNNNKRSGSLTDVLTLPYTESIEDVKKRYLDSTTWRVDSLGPGQASMCSISNIYATDIKGPQEEIEGNAVASAAPEDAKKAALQGGMFDQLFKGNAQHKNHFVSGTATWYMSEGSIVRDKTTMTSQGLAGFFDTKFWGEGSIVGWGISAITGIGTERVGGEEGTRSVGTSSKLVNLAYASLLGRDVWDGMLTLAGGDAKLKDLMFPLIDIDAALIASLAGAVPWKSYGSRAAGSGGTSVIPAAKPYYSVTFEYPLTENTFKSKFRLPGLTESEDGTTSSYSESELLPEEWGPGHVCYGFDTVVPQGQICGTYREKPEGVSRTCRVDKCVAFTRVETATCTCTRQVTHVSSTGVVTLGPPSKAKCKVSNREDRNLIVRDCGRDERLKCAYLQETSRAWQACPDGYKKKRLAGPNETVRCEKDADGNCYINSCYYQDKRTGKDTTGAILPPDDIDHTLEANDQYDHFQGYQDPPEIPDSPETCNPDMFDWGQNDKSKSRGLKGSESNVRPRCWVSAAGPFRKFPNFNAVGSATPIPVRAASGEEIKNCNGYIRIEDSALRAKQSAPYEDDGQKQKNLDESSIIGIKVLKSFMPPYSPAWGGNVVGLLDAQETNNGIVADQGLAADTYTRGQSVNMGGVGDVSTIRNLFTTPTVIDIRGNEGKLRPMYYHCDYGSSHQLDLKNEKQQEFFSMKSEYDPEFDGIGGWKCPIVPPPDPQLPNIEDKKSATCAVGSWGKCAQLLRTFWGNSVMSNDKLTETEKIEQMNKIGSWNFSRRFMNAINWAAYQSNTPGPALMTVMFLEGGLDMQYMDMWGNDADTYNAGGVPWYGQMNIGGPATCNDLVWTAQGPFQLIKHWVQCLVDPSVKECAAASKEVSARFGAALNKAGKGRPESVLNAGRCNLLDSAMIAAFLMNPEAGMHPGNCSGFDLETALQLFSGGSYAIEGGQGLIDTAHEIYATCRSK